MPEPTGTGISGFGPGSLPPVPGGVLRGAGVTREYIAAALVAPTAVMVVLCEREVVSPLRFSAAMVVPAVTAEAVCVSRSRMAVECIAACGRLVFDERLAFSDGRLAVIVVRWMVGVIEGDANDGPATRCVVGITAEEEDV